MVREFKEEAGVNTSEHNWFLRLVLNGPDWVVYFYTTVGAEFIPPQCNEGTLEWHFYDPPPIGTIPNLKWIIPLCFDTTIMHPITIMDSK